MKFFDYLDLLSLYLNLYTQCKLKRASEARRYYLSVPACRIPTSSRYLCARRWYSLPGGTATPSCTNSILVTLNPELKCSRLFSDLVKTRRFLTLGFSRVVPIFIFRKSLRLSTNTRFDVRMSRAVCQVVLGTVAPVNKSALRCEDVSSGLLCCFRNRRACRQTCP